MPTLRLLIMILSVSAATRVEYGKRSKGRDDALSSATCPTGYVAQTCRCKRPQGCDGVYFRDDRCFAVNAGRNVLGTEAVLTCDLEKKGNERYINIKIPYFRDRPQSLACSPGSSVVNCALHDPWSPPFPKQAELKGRLCTVPSKMCMKEKGCNLQVRCRVHYCGDPGEGLNSVKSGDFYVNDTVTYTCDAGYVTSSGVLMKKLTCLSNSTWDDDPLECQAPTVTDQDGPNSTSMATATLLDKLTATTANYSTSSLNVSETGEQRKRAGRTSTSHTMSTDLAAGLGSAGGGLLLILVGLLLAFLKHRSRKRRFQTHPDTAVHE